MTIEEIRELRKYAVEILKKQDKYGTANAVDMAFSSMIALDQIKWERDIAIEQLKELGISFGEKIDGKYISKEEYEQLLEYKYMYEENK